LTFGVATIAFYEETIEKPKK